MAAETQMSRTGARLATILPLVVLLWSVNIVWLRRDTRPPVWDMALHQSYALNYLPHMPGAAPMPLTSRSGNYPPFVHLAIALCYLVFHPGPHIAVLANIPATVLLLWSVYLLGEDLAGVGAARWACLLITLTPYLIWLSRETVLDYWLAAWVAAGLVALRKTEDFRSHPRSLCFGLVCALGMLSKWFFAGFLLVPVALVCARSRIWRDRVRLCHLADALLLASVIAGIWYLPNLSNLTRYFLENAQVGALEGEPRILSFQSFIYYLRLLEGYQLCGLLSLLLVLSSAFVWKRRLLRDGPFLLAAVCGGWAVMTLLRTKDPRFTMPLLGPLAIVAGAWLGSWDTLWWKRVLKVGLVALLCFQAYAANFGVRWIPEEVVLAKGYRGSVVWNWNLYLQDYFQILGRPRREDWKQDEILGKVVDDMQRTGARPTLALTVDLPRFNSVNFQLMARLRGLPVHVEHLRSDPENKKAFDGYDYIVMTEREQGMGWTTSNSLALNQIIVDNPETFRVIGLYLLPDGNCARLYSVQRHPEAAARESVEDQKNAEDVRRHESPVGFISSRREYFAKPEWVS
jgi:hypothetical protein